MLILHRADLVAGAAQRRGARQRAALAQPDELRRQDRADRARVDRVVGVPARALVDGADVQAGASSGCSAAPGGPTGSARTSVRPLSSRTRWNSCGPVAVGVRRSRATCTGSSARRSTTAAAAGGRPRGPRSVGHDLLDAHDRDERRRGSVGHIRPLPSDSTTQIVPVSATAKFAPLTADRARTGTARAGARGPPRRARAGSSTRSLGVPSVRRNSSRISARFLWIAGTRMCDGSSSPSWMISSARSVSMRGDARAPRAPRSGRSRRWSAT